MVVGFANQPIVVGSTGWVTQVKENKCDYETTHHEKKEMEHIFFSHVEEDIHDGIILGDSDVLVGERRFRDQIIEDTSDSMGFRGQVSKLGLHWA
jgi:hypothetical protein